MSDEKNYIPLKTIVDFVGDAAEKHLAEVLYDGKPPTYYTDQEDSVPGDWGLWRRQAEAARASACNAVIEAARYTLLRRLADKVDEHYGIDSRKEGEPE